MARITQNRRVVLFSLWFFSQSKEKKKVVKCLIKKYNQRCNILNVWLSSECAFTISEGAAQRIYYTSRDVLKKRTTS